MEIAALIERYPQIYHMAESGTWPSIREHGLLSATEVLRRAGLVDLRRSEFRKEKLVIAVATMGNIVLRDQKPMGPDRLERALIDGTTTEEWYQLINDRVFFWAREERLLGLLNAREYRDLQHDVLTVDTGSLITAHAARISLCHMNSGNTFPIPHRRGRNIFRRISDYEATRRGKPLKEVVEVTIDSQVLDIASHVVAVRRMQGSNVLQDLLLR